MSMHNQPVQALNTAEVDAFLATTNYPTTSIFKRHNAVLQSDGQFGSAALEG